MSTLTRITKLETKGFKSFANKTELLFGEKFNCVLGPNGSGKCVTGDTLVTLADGSITRIDALVNSHEHNSKTMDDGWVANGDGTKILGMNKDLKIVPMPITAFVKREAPEKLITIKTTSGRNITTTPYHPLFTLSDGKVLPIRADGLKDGLRIAVPRIIPTSENNNLFSELLDLISVDDRLYVQYDYKFRKLFNDKRSGSLKDIAENASIPTNAIKGLLDSQAINFSYLVKLLRSLGYADNTIIRNITHVKSKNSHIECKMPWYNSGEFSRLLGYLLAEGRVDEKSNQIWFTNGTEEVVKDYHNCVTKIFDIRATINEYKPNVWDVIAYSKPLIVLLKKFGMDSPTGKKTISNMYLKHSTNIDVGELLGALYSGDGYVSHNSIQITTKSSQLAFMIETLLLRLGMQPRVRDVIKIATNTGFSGKYKELSLYGVQNTELFSRNVFMYHNEKRSRLSNLLGKKENTNVDLLEVNDLIKKAVKENNLKIKNLRTQYPILESYVYNGSTPSRQGLNILLSEVFDNKTRTVQILETLAYSDIFWDEIASIENIIPEDKWVYDLCVEPNHNFIANNIIVHNSNVMDALCFVLGKGSSKDMRAEKSSNLIYNGGKLKNPAKEGEVSIFFDNHSKVFPEITHVSKRKKPETKKYENEIKITRMIKENGQSVYKINDRTKTRQEILDLLAFAKVNPDGYNIVLQGEIVNLIEMTPLQRRDMLEQIAGLSVYEEKKEKALRELQRVEEKMNEVEIILAERKTHLHELKRDRDQALKFKDLNDKIKRNKATILDSKIKAKSAERDKFGKEINDNNSKIIKLNEECSKIKEIIDQKKHDIEKINREIEEKGEKEQVAIHKEVEKLKIDLALHNQRNTAIDLELQKINERKSQLQNSLNDINAKIANLIKSKKDFELGIDSKDKELLQVEDKIKKFLEKNNLNNIEQIDKEIEQIDNDAEALNDEIQKLREQQQNILREKDKTEIIINNVDESIENVLKIEKENKGQLEKLKNKKDEFKKTTLELNSALSENSSLAAQIDNARSKILSRKEDLVKLNAKDMSLKESVAAGVAVQKILELKDSKPGIYGLVSGLGNVKAEFSLALEVAAGQRIKSVVVENDKVASECIKYLKDNKLGVVTFLPLNKIRSVSIKPELKNLKSPGIMGLAIDLISYDPKFEKVFSYIFENTIVVDNVETARKIGIGNYRMVTMTGDVIETSGAMQGGYRQKISGSGFQEKELRENIDKLNKEIDDANHIIMNLEQKRADNEELIGKLRELKSTLDGEIAAMEKTLHLDSNDLDISKKQKSELKKALAELDKNLDNIIGQTSEKNKVLAQFKIKKQQLRDKINELRNPALLAELNAFEQKRTQIKEELNNMRSEIRNNDAQLINVFNPEKDNITKVIKQQDKDYVGFVSESDVLTKKIKEQESMLKEKEVAEKKFFEQFKELFNKRNKFSDDVTRMESNVSKKQDDARTIEQKVNIYSLQSAEVRAQLSGMVEEFKQYESIELYTDKPESEILREIAQFENLILDIGAVNMRALEIYEKIDAEYKTFISKKDKILTERESVLVMINEIDSKKRELFMKTYEILDHNFKVIFSALSSKGEASLELEDPNDPFNGGLLLKVRITGTKFLDIKSLSGGEKTMAAIAFIFAVQEYDPAPFYILDEVDAALDKKNSEQLAQLIKNYSKKAQYIIISHNDGVISEADTLYGVSMNEHGISKVTTLKI